MKSSATNTDKIIETQIVSMLNEVMVDENSPENEDGEPPLKDKLFIQSDSESFEDERETNCSLQITFPKSFQERHERKSLPFPNQNKQNDFDNNSDFTRRAPNKNFKSQMMNSNISEKLDLIENSEQFSYKTINAMLEGSRFNKRNQINAYANPQSQNYAQMNNNININNCFSFNQSMFPFGFLPLSNPLRMKNSNNMEVPNSHNINMYYDDKLRAQQYNMMFHSKMPFQQNNPLFFAKSTFSPEEQIFSNYENSLANEGKFTYEIYQKYKSDFIRLIKNQQTSRLSQIYIQNSPPEIIHLLYSEISSQLSQLLFDPYANYFVLKLFYYLDSSDCLNFLNQISKNFTTLCINKISTYPIQCIVEHLITKQTQEIVIDSVKNHLMKITLDVYGTHVLEKILCKFDYDLIQPISKFVVDNFLFLANNANGLCVVKKTIIIEYKKSYFEKIKLLAEDNALMLIQNPFGNYALQCVIDNWEKEDLEILMRSFIGKCSVLSVQKYSSNVIEKCIEKSPEFLKEFLNECISNNYCGIGVLMQNNYGNYVIQTALKVTSGNERNEFIIGIEKNLSKLSDKKILSKWRNILINSPIIH